MRYLHICFILILCLVLTACKGENNSQSIEKKDLQEKDGGNNAKLDVAKKDYNVLLITIDTIRFDRLSIYSDRYVKTPNIDELARQSYLFTRAFAHNPVTLPSHTNILTGTTPRYHGISDNTGFKLKDKFLTISEYLKEKGYATGAFLGAFPLDSRFGLNQGFDVYDDNYGTHNSLELFFVERPAEKVIAPAVEWLSARESKWFAWVHLFDPHQPYSPPPPYDKEYSEDLYSGEVAYMDAALGKLFAFLKNSKFAENTVVIITGDHGEALYEKGEETHSYFAYNNTIHIPLIIHIPGTEPKTVAENVCHSDIFPTICDILGKEIPEHLQGETLLPIVAGNKRKNNTIYFESLTPFLNRGWAPLRGFIRENLKFIHLPIPEVYDIHTDLDENKNLAGKKEGQLFKLKRDLVMLKKKLTGKQMMKRSRKIDADSRSKLKSLGYLSGSTSQKKDVFTKEFDLKTMLPQQNRMQDAMNKYQKGMVEVPVAELKKILEKSPSFILVYKHIATILKESGRLNQAIEILRQGLKKNPGNPGLMAKLGIMLTEARNPAEAIELLEACVQQESFDPEHFNFLGVAYYKSGNFKLALANYQKALQLDNNYASAFNNIGSLYLVVYLKQKEEQAYRLALENFSRALEIDPRLFAAYNGRGAAYKFKNKIDLAIEDWKKTIEINPNFIDAYFNIGISCLEKGDKKTSLKYLLLCRDKFASKLPPREKQRLARLLAEARK